MLIFSRYTWWIGAMVALALLLTAASQVGALNPFQGFFLTVTSPVQNALSGTFRPVASFFSDIGDLNSLQDENRRLRLENEALRNQVATLSQNADDLKQAQQALGIIQADASVKRLAANVVSHDATPFTDVISIDRGTSSGVKAGMTVTSSQGTLLGTVTKALSDQSFVRLITDSKSKVAAQVQGSQSDGVVQGTAGRKLEFALAQPDVKVGDILVTSSLTGRFPANIPIGKVTAVSGSPQDIHPQVTIEPLVRISSVRTVLVILSFLPADASAGTSP